MGALQTHGARAKDVGAAAGPPHKLGRGKEGRGRRRFGSAGGGRDVGQGESVVRGPSTKEAASVPTSAHIKLYE